LFSNLCSSLSSEALQVVQKDMSGPLSVHASAIYTEPGLFERIVAVYDARHDAILALSPEQVRVVERFHLDFTRAGSTFDTHAKSKYAKIMKRLAELTTDFQQNVMKDESTWELELHESRGDLAGLSAGLVASMQQCAIDRGHMNQATTGHDAHTRHFITLSRSMVEPFLSSSTVRALRRQVFNAFTSRGQLDPSRDNLAIAREILSLRAEQVAMC
jgi:peptidyl-dipeptidase Dcp